MKKLLVISLSIALLFVCACSSSDTKVDQSSPEAVIKSFESAVNNRDADAIYKFTVPVELYKENGIDDPGVDAFEDMLNDLEEKYGKDFKIKCAVGEIEYMDSEIENISEMALVYVDINISSDEGKTNDPERFGTFKYKGKWYYKG